MHNSRINLERIFLDNTQKGIMEPLEITDSSTLKIYFESPVESLSSFFDAESDPNVANIKSIDFSHFDSSNIKDMSYLFKGCTSLDSVNFKNFNGAAVNNMERMFYNCNKIKSLDLSSFTFENIGKSEDNQDSGEDNGIYAMIGNCFSLISIDLTSFSSSFLYLSKIFEETRGYLNLNYINLYNSELNFDTFAVFTKKRLDFAMSKALYICTKEDKFSNCDEEYCKELKYLVKVCCNNGDENLKCGESKEDNYIMIIVE